MTKIKTFFGVALFATLLFTACEPKNPLNYDKGVVINGVTWATCNVDAFGTFASNPESYGKIYQWNRPTAYNSTSEGAITNWDKICPEGNFWEKANDPSPAGWRVPTMQEIVSLFEKDKVKNEWVEQNGVNGRKFTDLSTNKSIFLPAVGYRTYVNNNGTPHNIGKSGCYWSSTNKGSEGAYHLVFSNDSAELKSNYRVLGISVRSVAE